MQRFESFGMQHVVTVLGLVAAIAALCAVGRVTRGTAAGRLYERTLALGVVLLWVAYQVHGAFTSGFDVRYSIPLQLCDVAAIVAAVTFARPDRRLHALAYFWGLALSTQAVFTPDLTGGPRTLEFWAFWLYHMFVVGAGVYVVAVRGFRPRFQDLLVAVVAGVAYALVIFAVDATFDLNYGYLGRATPSRPTLIDHLGPWPRRVPVMVALATGAMVALWIPWWLTARLAPRPASPSQP